jgi:hypothetical protein
MIHRRITILAPLTLLTACAATPVDPPQTSVNAVRAIITANTPPLRVGVFDVAKSGNVDDKEIRLRAAGIKPPSGSSFSGYMGEFFSEQLRIVGKLDPSSPYEISGTMLENGANPAIGQASGILKFNFVLTLNGQPKFEKILSVETKWNSSFIGALAIPEAERQYMGLYPQLVEKLLGDPEFLAALKP